MENNKIHFIDHLRVLLTTLVILHHSFITYGAPGGWYYLEKTDKLIALVPMTMFVAVNQSFFMALFFFFAAYFTEPSYVKKGPGKFIGERLKRLGIPLIFYSICISPSINYLVERYSGKTRESFFQYLAGYRHWVDFGVLWFTAALLTFTLAYVLIRYLVPGKSVNRSPFPDKKKIWTFALLLGMCSFLVRIFFPVGWSLRPIGFQLAHFSQYIAYFSLGFVAFESGWLHQMNLQKAKPWPRVARIAIFLGFPSLYLIKILSNCPISAFSGGLSYQSFLIAVWEQITGVSMIIFLISFARDKWNHSSELLKRLARSSYCVYIIHPMILVPFALLFRPLVWDPLVKLSVVAPLTVLCTFLLGMLIVKIPLIKDVV